YRPEPYAIVDALMYADGKLIVDIGDMCIRFTGLTREKLRETWSGLTSKQPHPPGPPLLREELGGKPPRHPREEAEGGESVAKPVQRAPAAGVSPAVRLPPSAFRRGGAGGEVAFTRDQVLAYAIGKPSDAFGERYRAFDDRFLARLPGPPFLFVDRIV